MIWLKTLGAIPGSPVNQGHLFSQKGHGCEDPDPASTASKPGSLEGIRRPDADLDGAHQQRQGRPGVNSRSAGTAGTRRGGGGEAPCLPVESNKRNPPTNYHMEPDGGMVPLKERWVQTRTPLSGSMLVGGRVKQVKGRDGQQFPGLWESPNKPPAVGWFRKKRPLELAEAVINMLKIASLDQYFSAVWTMPWRQYMPNGAYKDQKGQWKLFDPPSEAGPDKEQLSGN